MLHIKFTDGVGGPRTNVESILEACIRSDAPRLDGLFFQP